MEYLSDEVVVDADIDAAKSCGDGVDVGNHEVAKLRHEQHARRSKGVVPLEADKLLQSEGGDEGDFLRGAVGELLPFG